MIEEYKMTFKRNLKHSFFIFLFLLTGLIIGLVFFLFFPVSSIEGLFKGCLLCSAITSAFWLPGILLHLSYYFNDKTKVVRLVKGGIELSNDNAHASNLIKYKSILKVERISTESWRLPWSVYGFVKITTDDNTIIRITCLLIDPFSLALQLSRNCKCKVEKSTALIPYFSPFLEWH
jgi:hypothetical protein